MSILSKVSTSTVLDVVGLALIALALGILHIAVGLGAAGVACLLLSWRGEQ